MVSRLDTAEWDAMHYLGHALDRDLLQCLHPVVRALLPLILPLQQPLHQRLLCQQTLDAVISTVLHLGG